MVTDDDDRGGNRLCREWELIPPWGIGGAAEDRERGGGGGKRGKIKGFSHGKHVRVTCVKYRYTHVGEREI